MMKVRSYRDIVARFVAEIIIEGFALSLVAEQVNKKDFWEHKFEILQQLQAEARGLA